MDDEVLLSVVVPVYNQAGAIAHNIEVIHDRVTSGLDAPVEVIVVSDGSNDRTDELLLEQELPEVRVLHYDRNLGKGYAVKLGALEARGAWIGFVDADLDLDPALLPVYVRRAAARELDFAIGSKRHPESEVSYPRSRVAASWLFQQLVRLLFRLNVRDTQAGIKVFRREVAEQVLPLLLVKRYAFDIELLAVARAFGFTRIEEMPIRLDYQFTGSGVRSRAVLRALVDTAAIFYRLRLLRYYQRRRRFSGAYAFTRPRSEPPSVSVLSAPGSSLRERDFADVEVVEVDAAADGGRLAAYRDAAAGTHGDVLAIVEQGVRPAGNWLSATTPFLARPEIAAVVTPKVAPSEGTTRERAAAAVGESRVGAGLGYFRHTPGNIRYVGDFPAAAIVLRRSTLLELDGDVPLTGVVRAVSSRGERVLYTPESVVVAAPAPLFGPHLRAIRERAAARGRAVRTGEARRPQAFAALLVVLFVAASALVAAHFDLPALAAAAAVAAIAYVAAVLVASAAAALRHQSMRVGLLTVAGIVATHAVSVAAFARGLIFG